MGIPIDVFQNPFETPYCFGLVVEVTPLLVPFSERRHLDVSSGNVTHTTTARHYDPLWIPHNHSATGHNSTQRHTTRHVLHRELNYKDPTVYASGTLWKQRFQNSNTQNPDGVTLHYAVCGNTHMFKTIHFKGSLHYWYRLREPLGSGDVNASSKFTAECTYKCTLLRVTTCNCISMHRFFILAIYFSVFYDCGGAGAGGELRTAYF